MPSGAYSLTKIVQTVKSITAREIFRRMPSVKAQLWGGAFWSSGFFMDMVEHHGSDLVDNGLVAAPHEASGTAQAGVIDDPLEGEGVDVLAVAFFVRLMCIEASAVLAVAALGAAAVLAGFSLARGSSAGRTTKRSVYAAIVGTTGANLCTPSR